MFDKWLEEADAFKGDKALYWAGRMSICVALIENSSVVNLSERITQLISCKNKYDSIIFSRMG
jgi:hypothetical protein